MTLTSNNVAVATVSGSVGVNPNSKVETSRVVTKVAHAGEQQGEQSEERSESGYQFLLEE